jgi:hypothetical protein
MNKPSIPESELDPLLKRALKDDLPPEIEAGMYRQLLRFKSTLGQSEQRLVFIKLLGMCRSIRKEILAVTSVLMMGLGLILQLSGTPNALAYSIEQLKATLAISAGLNRASFMNCTVLRPDSDGKQTSYHIRWRHKGDVRVDKKSDIRDQTFWISKETVYVAAAGNDRAPEMYHNSGTANPVDQTASEFLSPQILMQYLEKHYGLIQVCGRSGAGVRDFLILGRQGTMDIEIVLDAKTYLPKKLKKYSQDSDPSQGARHCILEVSFLWNQPIAGDVFEPQARVVKGK